MRQSTIDCCKLDCSETVHILSGLGRIPPKIITFQWKIFLVNFINYHTENQTVFTDAQFVSTINFGLLHSYTGMSYLYKGFPNLNKELSHSNSRLPHSNRGLCHSNRGLSH